MSRTSGSIGAFRELASGFFRPLTLLLYGNGANGERKGVFAHFAGVNRVSFGLFGVSFAPNETPNSPNETSNRANETSNAPNETSNRPNGVPFAPNETSNRAFGVSFALFGCSFGAFGVSLGANGTPNRAFGVSFAPNEHPNRANETCAGANETQDALVKCPKTDNETCIRRKIAAVPPDVRKAYGFPAAHPLTQARLRLARCGAAAPRL